MHPFLACKNAHRSIFLVKGASQTPPVPYHLGCDRASRGGIGDLLRVRQVLDLVVSVVSGRLANVTGR